jgi:hypothetical protein
MKYKKVIWLIGASLLLSSCLKETDLPMAADFRATAKNDRQTVPVTVQLCNLSYGADTYMWTFELILVKLNIFVMLTAFCLIL